MVSSDRYQQLQTQFTDSGSRTDIWGGFDLFLDTESFLNLGYASAPFSYLVEDPQQRLVERVLYELSCQDLSIPGTTILDIGCGRGGPARMFARHGYQVLGIDLVPYNIRQARRNTTESNPIWLIGDNTFLPFRGQSIDVVTAVDSIVYIDETRRLYSELYRILPPGGIAIITDLLVNPEVALPNSSITRFTSVWGMAGLETLPSYVQILLDTGFNINTARAITALSIDQFYPWTRLYSQLVSGPLTKPIFWLFARFGLDGPTIDTQIRAATSVLPALEHVLFTIEKPASQP